LAAGGLVLAMTQPATAIDNPLVPDTRVLVTPDVDLPVQEGDEGKVFASEAFNVWSATRDVVLAGPPEAGGSLLVDDEISVTVTREGGSKRTATVSYLADGTCDGGLVYREPISLKNLLSAGKNTVRITFRDVCGGNFGSSAIYLVGQGRFRNTASSFPGTQPLTYFALGDSYASGEGAAPFDRDSMRGGIGCHRSIAAGARRFGANPALPGPTSTLSAFSTTLLACSGNVIDDVAWVSNSGVAKGRGVRGPRQVDVIADADDPDVVSVSVGGNDVGFAKILTKCIESPACFNGKPGAKLTNEISSKLLYLNTVDPLTGLNALETVYQNIYAKAPKAKLLVVGYPNLLGTTDIKACKALFTKGEKDVIAQIVDVGDALIKKSAERNGATFVDLRPYFAGHGACDKVPYINRLRTQADGVISPESFHPNPVGQEQIARALRDAFSTAVRQGR
jgi:lysophospholipase L1-like esterase